MQFLGEIETITNDGKIVVTAVTAPEVNNTVYDDRENKIGTVKRIFGPVDCPYVTVVPAIKGSLDSLLIKQTYFKGETRDGKGKGRRGRN